MNKSCLFILGLFFCSCILGQDLRPTDGSPVNQLYDSLPADLLDQTLLVPSYRPIIPNEGISAEDKKQIDKVNGRIKEENEFIQKTFKKHYAGDFLLAPLSEVPDHRLKGHRYFLDVVIMPKQMKKAPKEALLASFLKYDRTMELFANSYPQFHYYFYIRDLQTDDAYFGSKMRGKFEVYDSLLMFLKQVEKDSNN